MPQHHLTQSMIATAGVIVVAVLFYVIPPAVTAQNPCGPQWWLSPFRAERNQCAEEKAIRTEKGLQDEYATAQAFPYQTVVPPTPDVNVVGTPLPGRFIPDKAKKIEPVSKDDVAEIPGLRGATSIWRAGALLNADEVDYSVLYVWSSPGKGNKHAQLGFYVFGNEPNLSKQHNRHWKVPSEAGNITITGIDGQITTNTGTIHFTTSAGKTGTFDVATSRWTIAP